MDNYEKLLEEKIENANNDLIKLKIYYKVCGSPAKGKQAYIEEKNKLIGEIEAYQDALNEYRQQKLREN